MNAMEDRPVPSVTVKMVRFRDGTSQEVNDALACEEPLEIRVRGESIAVIMRTPGEDEELACGFLFTEGLITQRPDIIEVAPCPLSEQAGSILNVFLDPSLTFDLQRLKRHTFASSSCGICGKATIESVHAQFPPLVLNGGMDPRILPRLPQLLQNAQRTFTQTGGLHGAGLFDWDGNLLVCREDVGRHNAVDKVVGWAFLNNRLPISQGILAVSGRTSFEIMQKALAARIPIVAAVSAPSSLAVDFARESNQTLIGFLRGQSFNVYSCPERLKG